MKASAGRAADCAAMTSATKVEWIVPVTYVIKFHVIPGKREEFLQLLCDVLDAMKVETTYREAVLHRDPVSENTFMLYETWESHDDVVNVQLHRPYRRAWHDALPSILASEREIGLWEPIKIDRKRT
ncbi:putative quinol monooxygenase [Bradyrhizobium sp. GCM10027634]|uniref:putative quinol monooxygenase n=1 Tax=Bradyrhizobium sp. GCM10027634 TaxID=3273383 RepID=UPI00366AD4C6